MTYLYGAGDYISMVNNTNGILNEVSPCYFDIDDKGNLKLNTIDKSLVTNMHSQGIKVVPFFSNHWDRASGRAALSNMNKIVKDIVKVVKDYNLDGVNIDLENLTEADRTSYISIAKLFRNQLPSDKSLVVSVAANPYDYKTGWHGSYDYEELAKYADYLMVMAYDEHYEGGEDGPVASIGFVEKSIKYAIGKVDKSKIVLGIPLYGRYWKQNDKYGGWAISIRNMEEIIKKYNGTASFDETSKSPKYTLTLGSVDEKPTIYNRTLTQGTYNFWYENEESIKAKLELVNQYDIKGAGTWRLGMEEKSLWDLFKEMLFKDDENNSETQNEIIPSEVITYTVTIFKDVDNNHWASSAITFLKEKGWINGKTEDLYAPEDNLTRGELSAIICRILNLDVNNSGQKSNYSDVQNHWAKGYISKLNELGIVNGYTDGSFKPDNNVSREEVAKIIYKVMELDSFKNINNKKFEENGNTKYSDLNGQEWSYEYIISLSSKKILNGYTNGEFKPGNKVTRAEIAQVIYNMWK